MTFDRSRSWTAIAAPKSTTPLGILGQYSGRPGKAGPDTHRRAMNREEERQLSAELERLKQEHRDLDVAIEAMLSAPSYDRLQVQRLKKRKLQLKDQINRIEDQLFPDIIA
jgi:hypothetical protein